MATATLRELSQAEFWGVALQALEAWSEWRERRPFRGDCPRCGGDVLVVHLFGEDAVVEVAEVLPAMRCPRCAANVAQGKLGTDPRAKPCWRCGGSAVVGGVVPSVGVLVAEDGGARAWTGGAWPRGGALHVPHRCDPPT